RRDCQPKNCLYSGDAVGRHGLLRVDSDTVITIRPVPRGVGDGKESDNGRLCGTCQMHHTAVGTYKNVSIRNYGADIPDIPAVKRRYSKVDLRNILDWKDLDNACGAKPFLKGGKHLLPPFARKTFVPRGVSKNADRWTRRWKDCAQHTADPV